MYRQMLQMVYIKYCQSKPCLYEAARNRARRNKNWLYKELRHGIISCEQARAGRKAIQRSLILGSHSIPMVIKDLEGFIEESHAKYLAQSSAQMETVREREVGRVKASI